MLCGPGGSFHLTFQGLTPWPVLMGNGQGLGWGVGGEEEGKRGIPVPRNASSLVVKGQEQDSLKRSSPGWLAPMPRQEVAPPEQISSACNSAPAMVG